MKYKKNFICQECLQDITVESTSEDLLIPPHCPVCAIESIEHEHNWQFINEFSVIEYDKEQKMYYAESAQFICDCGKIKNVKSKSYEE